MTKSFSDNFFFHLYRHRTLEQRCSSGAEANAFNASPSTAAGGGGGGGGGVGGGGHGGAAFLGGSGVVGDRLASSASHPNLPSATAESCPVMNHEHVMSGCKFPQ